MLHPGGPLNTFYSRRKEKKSLADWFAHMPHTEAEAKGFKLKITEEDDTAVFFE
jgi:hypothetical protein